MDYDTSVKKNGMSGGYIALMATIIISAILLVMAVEEGSLGWYSRFNILGTEAKEQANALAEGCADQALASIVTDPTYGSATTTVTTTGGTCTVLPVQFNTPATGFVTIKTQAEVRGSYANLAIAMDMSEIHLGTPAPGKGTLVVVTQVINDGSGTSAPSAFTIHVAGTNPSQTTFPGVDTGVVVTMDAGSYTVTETGLSNYTTTVSSNCSGNISNGQVKFCTVTNDDITTTLTLVANVTNNDSGSRVPGDFPLFIDGSPATLGTRYPVTGGTHSVTATLLAGYAASSWGYNCSGAIGSGTVTVPTGQSKTCVISFDDSPPPAPSCADSVMILDRTGSLFSNASDPLNEKNAALSLVNLYAGVLPPALPPHMGVGSIGGLDGSAASIPVLGQLSIAYANLTSAVNSIMANNSSVGSDLSAGITVANNELNSARHVPGNQKVLILVSDGDPNKPSGSTTFNTGFSSPAADLQNAAGDQWTNSTNAYANGAGDASATASAGSRHRFYNFGFGGGAGLPAGVTVSGIEAQVDTWATAGVSAASTGNLAPSTLSSTAGWNPNTGSDVSAVTVNDAGAYIVPGPQQESFGFANSGVPAGSTITSVTVHTVALGSGSTLQLMEENAGGTQILEPTTHALTAAYVDYSYTFPNMPSGAAWTLAEVNAWTTKFGVVNVSGNTARVTQMYVVVGYTAATPGSANPTGAPSFTSASSGAGSVSWSNPGNAQTTNSSYATAVLTTSNRTSQYLEQQGGFNIPAGATVTGIQVDVRRSATVANVLRDEVAQLIKGGSLAGNNQTGGGSYNIGTTDSTVTFGGAGNLWGTTWTPAQINAGTFGFAYEMYHSNSGGSATARVDSIIITVYYTTPSGGTSANLAPSTLSSTAGWNPNTGSDVSAVTVNDAGAYIVPGPQQESFGFANSGVPAGSTITSVTVHAVALGSGSTLQLMEENAGGTQILEPTTHALTAAYVDYSYTFPNMPSGAAWTLAEVNAWTTKFGVVNVSGNSARVTQMYVVVGYTAVGGVACQLGMDLSWNGGATWTTPEKTQTLTGTEATYTLGASNDDWTNSHTWAPADFSDANFRARVHAIDPGAACDNAAVDHLDWLQMKVHYTLNVDPIEEALKAADIAKKGPDGIAGNADDTDIFTIHFGADPGPYQGQKLMANLATGASAVTYNGITHQNGSVAQAGGVVTSDTGYIQPSAVSTPSQWTNPANAFTSDNVYATDAVNGHQQGYTTFGFTIPPTATITGVALSVEAKSSDSSGCQVGAELSSNNGTSFTTSGTNAGVTGSDVAYTLGGSASLWGRAWVPADFNNGSFVVRLQNIDPGNACVNGSTLSTDQIRARVYYSANTENSDGDNFFIAPSSADMQSIFNFIGNQVCPAAVNLTSIPPPTTGTLLVMTTVTNNNGGGAVASAFTANVSAVSPSQSSFAGSTSGVSVTVGPGSYSVTEGAVSGYNEILGATCSGTIVAGETRVCVLTNDDIPPPPPPPNFSVNVGSWQEVP